MRMLVRRPLIHVSRFAVSVWEGTSSPAWTPNDITMDMTENSATATEASDAELISQVRAGDIDAYGMLYDRHRDAARRLARQLTSADEADDLVSESFAKLLPVIQDGGGPDFSFRAYLLTCVRRVNVDRVRDDRLQPTDDLEPFDPGTPFEDPALDDFERAATARAFASLPERWQVVLWHTEVEGEKPADIAPLLGMTANSVAALAYRAREGLRQAYLRSHLADTADDSCRWVIEHLGGFVRGGLSRRDHARVEEHLDDCRKCTAVYLELVEVNSNLRVVLAPLLLGAAAAGYLTAAGHTGLAAATPWWLRGRKVLRGHQGAAAAAVAAVAVTAIAATAVIGTRDTGADNAVSSGPESSSELNDDSSSDDSNTTTDRPDGNHDRPDAADKDRNRDRADRDRERERADRESSDDTESSPSATDNGADEPGSPADDPTTESTQTEPTETGEPTDDPSTEPTETGEPTDDPSSEPTNEPGGPLADLGVGPKIAKHDFLGLLWNEVTVPASGVQKVDSATMVVKVENLVSWSDSNGGGDVADWSCGQVNSETLECTLGDVERARQPQDLGLSLLTSGTSSEVAASISASDYRDPKPRNNSVSTHVVL
jgi:RNA polymerase sigma factor (sigma-70 family)